MIWILIVIFSFYCFLIIWLTIGFSKVVNFIADDLKIENKFSIIIPFRNEAKNLPLLLDSILKLNYPNHFFEIILVDDDSTDDSVEIIKNIISVILNEERRGISKLDSTNLNEVLLPIDIGIKIAIRTIQNQRKSNSPKKDAISSAIKIAKYNWIITTDADCILPENWLKTFDNFIQKNNPKMIVAPVSYQTHTTFLEQFQLFDFFSLQGATIGGFGIKKPFLCNGANLCYKKEYFLKLNGFSGNDEIASGDDIFLLEKFIKEDIKSVQFLKSKDAIVKTFPLKSWNNLLQQRIRWAAKTRNYKLWFGKLVGLIIFAANLGIVLASVSILFNQISLLNLIYFWIAKLLIDYLLIRKSIVFFEQKTPFRFYFASGLIYPFFNVLVVFTSLFTNYNWKGRSFKK